MFNNAKFIILLNTLKNGWAKRSKATCHKSVNFLIFGRKNTVFYFCFVSISFFFRKIRMEINWFGYKNEDKSAHNVYIRVRYRGCSLVPLSDNKFFGTKESARIFLNWRRRVLEFQARTNFHNPKEENKNALVLEKDEGDRFSRKISLRLIRSHRACVRSSTRAIPLIIFA